MELACKGKQGAARCRMLRRLRSGVMGFGEWKSEYGAE
jgi:hypothetical protein